MCAEELNKENLEEQDKTGGSNEDQTENCQHTAGSGEAEVGTEQYENGAAEPKVEPEDKYQELFGQYQRLQADFDNFRKRVRREKEDTLRFAQESLINELLPVMDNLQRALAAGNESAESLKSGVELIYRQLEQVLKQQGVDEISSLGNPFDPNLHQAVMRLATDEYPHNSIVLELQKGYTIRGKVLRPSMVQVADNTASIGSEKSEEVAGLGES